MNSSGVIKLQYLSEGKLRQARDLRKNMTHAEKLLWEKLRRKQLGVKIRRQQVIKGFIVDFFCEKAKLVIEVDGSIHDTSAQKKIDEHRREVFEQRGLKEIRFRNEQIEENIDKVISTIREFLPPLTAGEEGVRGRGSQ